MTISRSWDKQRFSLSITDRLTKSKEGLFSQSQQFSSLKKVTPIPCHRHCVGNKSPAIPYFINMRWSVNTVALILYCRSTIISLLRPFLRLL